METFHAIAEYRAWRQSVTGDIGYVASLGYLHDGHRSLMQQARAENSHVVMTLYVNPLQFAAGEDLDRYPRDPERDAALCASEQVSALLLLSDEDMYPPHFATRVTSMVSAGRFEAAFRPGHFTGVTTVVAKLFNIVRPARTYFGLKDYQQLLVVRQLVQDLNMDIEVIPAETVREADGLAMSSRNSHLSAQERRDAPLLYRALREVQSWLDSGERAAAKALEHGRSILNSMSVPVTVDYFAAVDPRTLEPVDILDDGIVVLAAIRLPSVRLIDNIVLARGSRHAVGT